MEFVDVSRFIKQEPDDNEMITDEQIEHNESVNNMEGIGDDISDNIKSENTSCEQEAEDLIVTPDFVINSADKDSCNVKLENGLSIENIEKTLYRCQFCNEIFQSECRYLKHKRIHVDLQERMTTTEVTHTEKLFQCNACPMKFSFQSTLDIHTQVHIKDLKLSFFQCIICNATFRNEITTQRHIYNEHKKSKKLKGGENFYVKVMKSNESYVESILDKTTILFNTHKEDIPIMLIPRKNNKFCFKCIMCAEMFKNVKALETHVTKHNWYGVTPFECEICNLEFGLYKYYLLHINAHINNITYIRCNLCYVKLYSQTEITSHYEKSHPGVDTTLEIKESKHKVKCTVCLECNKVFFSENAQTLNLIKLHMESHYLNKENCKNVLVKNLTFCEDCGKILNQNSCCTETCIFTSDRQLIKPIINKEMEINKLEICYNENEIIRNLYEQVNDKFSIHYYLNSFVNKNNDVVIIDTKEQIICIFECKICLQRFLEITDLHIHYLNHHTHTNHCSIDDMYLNLKQCEMCNATNLKFYEHYNYRHESVTCYYCDSCLQSFVSYSLLEEHKNVNNHVTMCPYCNIAFEDLQMFQVHMVQDHVASSRQDMAMLDVDVKEEMEEVASTSSRGGEMKEEVPSLFGSDVCNDIKTDYKVEQVMHADEDSYAAAQSIIRPCSVLLDKREVHRYFAQQALNKSKIISTDSSTAGLASGETTSLNH